MKWNIVTDSSCDIFPDAPQDSEVHLSSVPFTIRVGEREYIDDETLNTGDMLDDMERCKDASQTACPSPQGWMEQFEKAGHCIAVTISSKLSGSMNSAMLAKQMLLERCRDKKIAILDSRSTGPEIALCVERIREMIKSGASFERVVADANAFLKRAHIAFALSSLNNLIKNGRMSRLAGFIAGKLGIWGIGVGSDEGTISIKGKTRGSVKAIAMLLEDMKEHGFRGGKVMISHCHNLALAEKLKDKIKETWSDSAISIVPTRGLCSYYAERGGLILSYWSA